MSSKGNLTFRILLREDGLRTDFKSANLLEQRLTIEYYFVMAEVLAALRKQIEAILLFRFESKSLSALMFAKPSFRQSCH